MRPDVSRQNQFRAQQVHEGCASPEVNVTLLLREGKSGHAIAISIFMMLNV